MPPSAWRGRVRALSVDRDVVVLVSAIWQTTCTAVRAGNEGFVIDSPVLPDELDALEGILEQAGFPVSGILATHGDWDHLLASLAFPGRPVGSAPSTAARIASEPDQARERLRRFDEEHYVQRPAPLEHPAIQQLPVPGHLRIGPRHELELHPAPGHTGDGMAVWVRWARVLVCGDYLSPIEIPMISPGGSLEGYRTTLERLRGLAEQAETVIPGHGHPLTRAEALAICAEDLAYLGALSRGETGAPLPPGRSGSEQRRIHAENLKRVLGRS